MMNEKILETELETVAGGAAASSSNYYVVVRGDTLSGIAKKHGTTVSKLLKLNPHISNPDLIYPGDRIRIW